ncbi:MAG: hypothetical protein APF77_03675 [Clostridia bacterium BRH_c25]|nr:MAG: hypothetical protein APF77_03675 [Clostridia bacterium BRH_c25]
MKKTLRLTAVLMCMVLLVASLAACSKTQQTQATPTESQEEKLKVAMVCSMGGLGDRSYNDSGYVGLQKVEKELGLEVKVVEPKDVSEGEKYLTELAQAGYNLVMTLEYGHADILKKVAPQFPETRFAIFNIEVDEPNVTSVVFKEHEGSYLAGALAALVTKDANIKETNPEKVLGFIGGIQSPGIDKFLVGFEEGAKYIDKDTKVISGYANSFGDPAKGKEMALVQMEQGADIVYQVAGGTGEGVINAAKDKGCFAIGVDSDQDYIAPGNVLTSMMKRVDVAVFELSKQLKDGSIKNSNTMILGLKEDGVGLSPMEYTKDLIPKEYFDQVEQLKKAIVDGEIKVTDITQN